MQKFENCLTEKSTSHPLSSSSPSSPPDLAVARYMISLESAGIKGCKGGKRRKPMYMKTFRRQASDKQNTNNLNKCHAKAAKSTLNG